MSGGPFVRRVIVGTAGHVDHGKTTLVERLTGIRTDRLPEEQARGMTIDVGYAELRLPDGTEVGLLDVPGHERLLRTMVAAATSLDVALLVVAADDGVMPQTREHVDVLDLLGVRRGVVALTKTDLVPPERVEEATAEVRRTLAGTTLADLPVLPVSSTTGSGLDALRAALAAALEPFGTVQDDGKPFRMWVLRSFVAPGRGTVVTGIPSGGRLVVGDEVALLPVGTASRVRGIHVHHRAAGEAQRATRTALLVPDLPHEAVERGMVLAAAGMLTPAAWVAAHVRLLAHVRAPLRHAARVRLHLGSADVPVRVHLIDAATLVPGAAAAVHLQALEPLHALPGDRFLLRAENASDTLGGGMVVLRRTTRPRRTEPGEAERIVASAGRVADPAARVVDALRSAGRAGASLALLAVETGLRPDVVAVAVEALAVEGRLVRGPRGLHWDPAARKALDDEVLRVVRHAHAERPAVPYVALAGVRGALAHLAEPAVTAALEAAERAGVLRLDGRGGVALAEGPGALSSEQRRRLARALEVLDAAGGAPPDEAELAAAVGVRTEEARALLKDLQGRGEAVRAQEVVFAASWVVRAKALLADLLAREGPFTPSQACKALGTSRKYVLPLLETLDRQGFTVRSGSVRTLRPPRGG